jgi:hypothetical protein
VDRVVLALGNIRNNDDEESGDEHAEDVLEAGHNAADEKEHRSHDEGADRHESDASVDLPLERRPPLGLSVRQYRDLTDHLNNRVEGYFSVKRAVTVAVPVRMVTPIPSPLMQKEPLKATLLLSKTSMSLAAGSAVNAIASASPVICDVSNLKSFAY